MNATRSTLGAKATLAATAAVTLAALVLTLTKGDSGGSGPVAIVGVALGLLGLFIVSRARNLVGWFFLGGGLSIAVSSFTDGYIHYSLLGRSTPLPGTSLAGWLSNMAFGLTAASLPLIFLVFPTGRLPSPRWRPLLWVWAVSFGLLAMAVAIRPGNVFATPADQGGIDVVNPIGIAGMEPILRRLIWAAGAALTIVGVLSIASLILRFRRARGEERQQMKWLAYVAILIALLWVAMLVIDLATNGRPSGPAQTFGDIAWVAFVILFLFGIPAAVAVAVLKYRLYDIDVVINKTLVYGSLATFITAVYIAVVVLVGSAFGRGDEPNLALSIVATAVVAVAFQPVRGRVQHLANRLVYGKRATPYEVLSGFAHDLSGTYAADDILPRMARILSEGTGGRAGVWLETDSRLVRAASWPSDGEGQFRVDVVGGVPEIPGSDVTVPVTHQGERLGVLSIAKPRGERVTPAEEKLIRDIASQAGLVLRNVGLIEDLKASRVRLVQAQDQERRRIERNIHDGAQQQLVALQVKLGLARREVSDPQRLEALLAELQAETGQALQDLRDLARGIYPPLLSDQGLVAALEAQARKAPVPVEIAAGHLGRYAQEVEAAMYFCVLEALQNVAKYAHASTVTVQLSASNDQLAFTVTDDGEGFDPSVTPRGSGLTNMADRLAALGGAIEVRSASGHGTTVAGSVPATTVEAAATA